MFEYSGRNYEHTLIHQLHQFCAIGKWGKYFNDVHPFPGFDMKSERWNGGFGKEADQRQPAGRTQGWIRGVDNVAEQDKR